MASLLAALPEGYKYLFIENTDPRTRGWFLMSTPFHPLLLVILYQYFVKVAGPKLMKKRKPMTLNNVLILYNIFQILINSYLVIQAAKIIREDIQNILCSTVDYSDSPKAINALLTYTYYISRVIDLLDTIFMILRKKFNQVSFLHVYHHSVMILLGWIFTAYAPGGHAVYFGIINSFVHCIMYFYYLLMVIDPAYKTSVWWKKHLTQLQLVQFVIITIHSALVGLNPNCKFSKLLVVPYIPQGIFMYILFWDFYQKTYINNKKNHTINKTD
ncbi:very long chain fatty acid elongase 7-like isoform X2 [Lycorma delicatula]|uniref:very long chain fatty acid elongase 7-like isoform X2 n=1 Tax=Lycorma delicatula TaxID=130591 RepID=UPI003F5174AB